MPQGTFGLTIADVCGHGVGPSILMAQARAYLRMLALAHDDPGAILRQLNEILTVEGSQREFVTQLLVRLDPRTHTLTFANAGHPPGLILGDDGRVRRELPSGGLPLGIRPDRSYPTSDPIPLAPGEVVILYSDGITESENPSGEPFGLARLVEVAARIRHRKAGEIEEALCEAAREFRGPNPQLDDLTVLICKVEP